MRTTALCRLCIFCISTCECEKRRIVLCSKSFARKVYVPYSHHYCYAKIRPPWLIFRWPDLLVRPTHIDARMKQDFLTLSLVAEIQSFFLHSCITYSVIITYKLLKQKLSDAKVGKEQIVNSCTLPTFA